MQNRFVRLIAERKQLTTQEPVLSVEISITVVTKTTQDILSQHLSIGLQFLELHYSGLNLPLIDRQQFEETVRTLNNLYAEAEKLGSQSYLEGCLACLTAYTIFLCMETHYEKVLKKIAKYIQEQNEKIYAPQGLLLTDPIERGLRVVSFPVGS
uniref:Golgin subfamily A member 7 n=1 Tax=Laticauda laticaudata TaxID=8630 RepID=A0A8C5RHD9_LATLA